MSDLFVLSRRIGRLLGTRKVATFDAFDGRDAGDLVDLVRAIPKGSRAVFIEETGVNGAVALNIYTYKLSFYKITSKQKATSTRRKRAELRAEFDQESAYWGDESNNPHLKAQREAHEQHYGRETIQA